MKAISLHQPHASLMACGAKTIETRSRLTNHRGDIAICSTKKKLDFVNFDELFWLIVQETMKLKGETIYPHLDDCGLPLGFVLCVVEIYDCQPSHLAESVAETNHEIQFGDYSPGRFGWLTRNVRKLKTPIPVIGRQFIFNLPADVERNVRKQIKEV